MNRFLLHSIKNLIVLFLFRSSANAQVDWSLSANFVAADAADGPHWGLAHHRFVEYDLTEVVWDKAKPNQRKNHPKHLSMILDGKGRKGLNG